MQVFPDEYKPHIRQYHVGAVVFSGVLILVGIVALVVLMIGPSEIVNGLVKKILGGLVVFGIPGSVILLTLTISVVNYRFNKSRRESLGAKESIFSVTQRANIISTIKHAKYDYRNASNIWIKTALLLFSIFAVIGTLLIISDPQPAHALFIGILFLLGPLCSLGLGWLVFIKPKRFDYVELAAEGIRYQTNGRRSLLPWPKVKEIQNLRGTYIITTEDDRLVIWSDIEPSDIPSESFFAGLFRDGPFVRELIKSIKILAPHIYQKESVLSREINLPISNKVIVIFLVVLMLLFFIVIIRGIANV